MALPLVLLAGLSFSINTVATPATVVNNLAGKRLAQTEQSCDFEHKSDVCVLNNSGKVAYITIKQFGVEKDEIMSDQDLMSDYFSEKTIDPIEVTVYDSHKSIIYREFVPNHGPILEIVNEKSNSKQLSVKLR